MTVLAFPGTGVVSLGRALSGWRTIAVGGLIVAVIFVVDAHCPLGVKLGPTAVAREGEGHSVLMFLQMPCERCVHPIAETADWTAERTVRDFWVD